MEELIRGQLDHFCRNCGSPLSGELRFCRQCGKARGSLEQSVEQPPVADTTLIRPLEPPPPASDPAPSPQAEPLQPALPAPLLADPPGAGPTRPPWGLREQSQPTEPGPEPFGPPASFAQRLGARLLDGLVTFLLSVPIGLGLFGAYKISQQRTNVDAASVWVWGLIVAFVAWAVVPTMYLLVCDATSGRTVGQAAAGVRLVRLGADRRIGFWRALARRSLAGFLDNFFFLNSLSLLWNSERRSIADRALGTAVLQTRSGRGPGRGVTTAIALSVVAGAAVCGIVAAVPTPDGSSVTASTPAYGGGSSSQSNPSAGDAPTYSGDLPSSGNGVPSSTSSTGAGGGAALASAVVTVTATNANLRSGPGSDEYVAQTVVPQGGQLTAVCRVHGQSIGGDDIWYATRSGWVSDSVVTGSTSAVPVCGGTIRSVTSKDVSFGRFGGPFPLYAGGATVTVRSAPSSSASGVTSLDDGTFVDPSCSASGDYVSAPAPYGGNSTWDRIDAPVSGWVPDALVNSHSSQATAPTC